MIGQADLHQGLYYLQDFHPDFKRNNFSVNVVLNYKESDVDIWYCRLGHPNERTIEHICKTFRYVYSDLKIDVCDICHLAKQHKLPFSQSNTKSLNLFDLIHVDI